MKKKITILMLLSIVMMTSCINPYVSGVYNLELKEVERPKNAEERYGDYKVVNLNKEGINTVTKTN